MKKLLTLLLVCAAMGACTQDAPEVELADFGNLDETGLQFIEMLQKRPDWQTEWAEMTEHGQPLPNEMIVLSGMGTPVSYVYIPVVDDQEDSKRVVRLIVCKLLIQDGVPTLGKPYVFDEANTQDVIVARNFVGMNLWKSWEEKGYTLDFEVEMPQSGITTTRGVIGWRGSVELDILYASIVVDPLGGTNWGEVVKNERLIDDFVNDYNLNGGRIIDFRYEFSNSVTFFVEFPDDSTKYDAISDFCYDLKIYLLFHIPNPRLELKNIQVSYSSMWGDAFYDYSENEFVGGGGGYQGGGGLPGSGVTIPTQPTVPPGPVGLDVSKLFKGNLTESEWGKLESMLTQVMIDCMGGYLYSALCVNLGSNRFTIDYNPSSKSAQFNGGLSIVRINSLDDVPSFMHELFHSYQFQMSGAVKWNQSTANLEIEAQLAKHMFMQHDDPKVYVNEKNALVMVDSQQQTTYNRELMRMSKALNKNGLLKNPALEANFMSIYTSFAQSLANQYSDQYTWDSSLATFGQSMKNIQALAKNC